MASVEKLPDLGGIVSDNCPAFKYVCWEKCFHENLILSNYYNFENYNNSPRHKAIAKSILEIQDSIIKSICEYEIDVCVKGALRGFPCVQCKDVCTSGTQAFDCGYDKITFASCKTTEIDFQSNAGLKAIYDNVIKALAVTFSATVKGVEDFANIVFGTTTEVIRFQNDTMYLDTNKTLTADELTAWNFIKDTFPLPIGTTIELVKN